jgi:hypothetical protein
VIATARQNRFSRPVKIRLEEIVPYEEFRKLVENQTPPSRWEKITLGSVTKWTLACALIVIAVLVR